MHPWHGAVPSHSTFFSRRSIIIQPVRFQSYRIARCPAVNVFPAEEMIDEHGGRVARRDGPDQTGARHRVSPQVRSSVPPSSSMTRSSPRTAARWAWGLHCTEGRPEGERGTNAQQDRSSSQIGLPTLPGTNNHRRPPAGGTRSRRWCAGVCCATNNLAHSSSVQEWGTQPPAGALLLDDSISLCQAHAHGSFIDDPVVGIHPSSSGESTLAAVCGGGLLWLWEIQ